MKHGRTALFVMLASIALSVACVAFAQSDFEETGRLETPEEMSAMAELDSESYVQAREKAEKILRAHPDSFVAHFVLGSVQQDAEANFPRALYELQQALHLFEARYGREPTPAGPWRWHARLLISVGSVHNDMDQYEEFLGYLARYNERYRPTLIAERAWPLMKLGRFADARNAARLAMASESPWQKAVALTALCAIEFEAGDDGASYAVCKQALDDARERGENIAVELTNFAEASRSMFKLDEAETVTLEATRVASAPFGNPWIDLAELYLRESRFAEALSALKEVPRYRMRRPPAVRDADRNEARRSLASFFLVLGRVQDALHITERALVMPDRRAHNSRDPSQDRVIVALIDRAARRIAAEDAVESAVGGSLFARLGARIAAALHRIEAWQSGRVVEKLLADEAHLIGIFKIGTARSAIMPPWLVGELVDTLGAGVVRRAVEQAKASDRREVAKGYYDAVLAEAAWSSGDDEEADRAAREALRMLPTAESLMRARVELVRGASAWDRGDRETAKRAWDAVFQSDPGAFRRLDVRVPVHVAEGNSAFTEAVYKMLGRSPRFDFEDSAPYSISIEGDRTHGRICLLDSQRNVLGCGESDARSNDDVDALAARVVNAFHAEAFAPRVSLSQTEANSLDGANGVTRNPLKSMFGEFDAEP